MHSISPRHILPLLLFTLASWPAMTWYARRMSDQSDEPLGLLALAVALCIAWSQRHLLRLRPAILATGTALLALATFLGLPPLLLAFITLFTFTASLHSFPGKPGLSALLLLSLPLMASLDFYAGYPMRLAAASLAQGILHLCGLAVERSGVLLMETGQIIGVDPPCSGIRMLWTSLFAAAVLAARSQASIARTFTLLAASTFLVVLGNALRSTILFFPESGRVNWPHWTHEGTGLLIHALILLAIFTLGGRLQGSTGERKATFLQPSLTPTRLLTMAALPAVLVTAFGVWHLQAATVAPPLFGTRWMPWPSTLDGVPLHQLPPSERERNFAKAFPGEIATFQCGDAEVILRRVQRPTRLLHSSADCLRASGYNIKAKPVFQDEDHRIWGCSLASARGKTSRLRERITNTTGTTVATDVSAWYWSALTRPTDGPWLAVTVLEPIPDAKHP